MRALCVSLRRGRCPAATDFGSLGQRRRGTVGVRAGDMSPRSVDMFDGVLTVARAKPFAWNGWVAGAPRGEGCYFFHCEGVWVRLGAWLEATLFAGSSSSRGHLMQRVLFAIRRLAMTTTCLAIAALARAAEPAAGGEE